MYYGHKTKLCAVHAFGTESKRTGVRSTSVVQLFKKFARERPCETRSNIHLTPCFLVRLLRVPTRQLIWLLTISRYCYEGGCRACFDQLPVRTSPLGHSPNHGTRNLNDINSSVGINLLFGTATQRLRTQMCIVKVAYNRSFETHTIFHQQTSI